MALFHWAWPFKGHTQLVQLLLQQGADTSIQDMAGGTQLHLAASGGHTQCVQLLLQQGADTSVQNRWGSSPLHLAADDGHTQCVQLLLQHGADTSIQDMSGKTPLHLAASNGHTQCVQLLLRHGADTSIQNKENKTPRMLAEEKERLVIVELLRRFEKPDVKVYIQTRTLQHLAEILDPAEYGAFYLNNLNPNCPDIFQFQKFQGVKDWITKNNYTTIKDITDGLLAANLLRLSSAAVEYYAEVLTNILNMSPDEFESLCRILARDEYVYIESSRSRGLAGISLTLNPYYYDAFIAHRGEDEATIEPVLHQLKECGIECFYAKKDLAVETHVITSIIEAVSSSRHTIVFLSKSVQLLLQHGADTSIQDMFGRTPLHNAASSDHSDVAFLLHKADLNSEDRARCFMDAIPYLVTLGGDERNLTINVGGKYHGVTRPLLKWTIYDDINRDRNLMAELIDYIKSQDVGNEDTGKSFTKYFPHFMRSIPDVIPEFIIYDMHHKLVLQPEKFDLTPLTEFIRAILPQRQCSVVQKPFEDDTLLSLLDQDRKFKAGRFLEAPGPSMCDFQDMGNVANAKNCSLETNMGMDLMAYQMFLIFMIWQGIMYLCMLTPNLFKGPIIIIVYLPLCTILSFEVTYILLLIGGVELNPGPNTNQGYKVRLKDPAAELPSHLLCVKCNLLLRKPRQTVCGHRLCSGCLHEHVSSGPQKCVVHDCPDIIPSEDQVYPDRAVEREVLRLDVVCTNEGSGCPWEGKLKDYEAHEAECEFIRQPCGRSGCKDFVYKKDLERHLKEDCLMRPVDCEYCKAKLVFKDVKDHHLSDCPEFPVECDQCHISKIFTRLQLKNHQDLVLGDCPVKLAQCSFASFGCTKKVKPEEIGSHLKDNLSEHVDLLFHKMDEVHRQQAEVNVQHQNGEADRQCGELDSKLQAVQRTLTDLDKMIRAEGGQEPRPTPGQSREVNEVRAMMDERERKLQRCEEAIIDLARKLEVLFQQIDFYERERQKNQELMQAAANKITMLERSLASKDDTLQLNDTRVENLERATYNGILVWKITDFGRRRQDAVNNRVPSFYSPPFYTSKSGYKMCARIYLNGDGMGKGTHISLFFVICKGSNDALLRWPFRQKVTLMLLDQNNKEHIIDAFRPDPSSSSFKKPTNEMNIASGCPMFATLSQLDSPSHAYIKDDTVFFKIIVDCADLQ